MSGPREDVRAADASEEEAVEGVEDGHVAHATRSAPEPLFLERPDGLRHLPPQRARAFLGLVRAGAAVARDLDASLQQHEGLGLHGFEVLLHLAVFSPGGRLRLTQLVEQAPLSQSRVSRLVADLEREGLVERTTAADDRRGVEVAITAAGLDRFRRAQDRHLRDLNERVFSRLRWDEIVLLGAITDELLAETDDGEAAVRG